MGFRCDDCLCPICKGTGFDPEGEHYEGSASHICPRCKGTGKKEDAKTYKVWLHVEEIDEANDSYSDDFEGSRLPISVGEYITPGEAYELVDKITNKYL